ncbi:MAG TPA: YkvA family protein [Magnetospirillum sp.]|nr:YkvA family protein [Magnetospirillum sp.]
MDTVSSKSFWAKIRHTAGKVPFLDDVVAVWFCARDPATPTRVRATLLGTLAYFILPFDAIPDFVVGLGYTDDLAVLIAAIRSVLPHITDDHRTKARQVLSSGDFPA